MLLLKKQFQRILKSALSFAVAIGLGVGFSLFAAFAWVDKTDTPTNVNAKPPIFANNVTQNKNGGLSVTELTANGDLLIPQTGYLNWGNTSGSGGYGFRSNGGAMQFRNGTGGWTVWTNLGTGFTHQQYGFTNFANWDVCKLPSATGIVCEIRTTINNALSNGWTEETGADGTKYIYKLIPDQSTAPWKMCSMNGYTTQYDWNSFNFVVKKPDNKWYVYFEQYAYVQSNMSIIANCWR